MRFMFLILQLIAGRVAFAELGAALMDCFTLGAIRVKDAGTVAAKWAAKGQAAGKDYKDGIANPKRDYAEATAAAEGSYNQGVQEAIAQNRFAKGVQKAGTEKWRRKASDVGSQRFTTGVQAAQADMAKGIAPVLQVIASIDLPPRGPKGSPSNIARVSAVAERLRAMKTQS